MAKYDDNDAAGQTALSLAFEVEVFYLNDLLLSAIATKEDRGYGKPKEAFKRMADNCEQRENGEG